MERPDRVAGPAVGLDIGGTKVLGVLLGADDDVLDRVRVPTRSGADGVVASAAAAVRRLTDAAGIAPVDLAGLGLGVPGVVDRAAGTVAHAVNLGIGDAPVPLGRMLRTELDSTWVSVDNDLNAAAAGAAHVLGDRADVAYLALGTGVAAGLLLDGRLRRGWLGAAGEIGHLPYDRSGPLCPCGQRGCLELYASGGSLDARWPGDGSVPAPAALFAAAATGDPRAVAVRDEFADAVAAAVRILVLTTDVERVVLGGGVREIGAPLLRAVTGALERQASASGFLASMRLADRVELAPRGVPVAAIGAALAARGTVSRWRS
ncbi:ROK family protein [uncultured Cellulomonas sp.]|uniref:ROK family protein n=1 Tax=uncultured Cellulomonas sp. TaxID=189682 RepID=UPI002619E90A|nr:ROK family protein [uncultured Cellulomonas sp.]